MNNTKASIRTMKAATSLTPNEFVAVRALFCEAWFSYETCRKVTLNGNERLRKYGGGRRSKLKTIDDKLFFILFWFKVYPTLDIMARIFGISQPQAHYWTRRLTPVLELVMKKKCVLPARQLTTMAEVMKIVPDIAFIVDGTERPICRPTSGMKKKACYSGRKKRYAEKNIIAVQNRKVVLLGKTYPGSYHDKKCIDLAKWKFDGNSTILADSGFEGYKCGGVVITHKKKRKGFTKLDRRNNRKLSKKRIVVEHVIAGIKRSRIASDILRIRTPKLSDKLMLIACGLHNFRTQFRAV